MVGSYQLKSLKNRKKMSITFICWLYWTLEVYLEQWYRLYQIRMLHLDIRKGNNRDTGGSANRLIIISV